MNIEITPEELTQILQSKSNTLILDIRAKENYMSGHISGAANAVCNSMQQKQIIMSKIPPSMKVILIDNDGAEAKQNATMMARFGFDAHYLKDGIKSWGGELVKSTQDTVISGENLWNSIKSDSDVFLLDVREPQEFAEYRIPGAINIPLSQLFMPGSQSQLPKDKKIVTICSHGNRSMVATFALAQNGLESTSLVGGMSLWNQVLNPTTLKENDITVIQVEKVGKGCLSHIIGSNGEAVVIDPTYPPNKYVEFAQKEGLKITKVIDTHQHADHVSAAKDLARITSAKLYLSKLEEYKLDSEKIEDGNTISFGTKQLRVIHTPGHTPGGMTFVLDDKYVFSGDILFVEGIGRPDLRDQAEEFAAKLYDTLHNKILKFGDDAKIFPTHHGEGVTPTKDGIFYTTVQNAKKLPLLDLDQTEFVAKVVSITTPRPMNYSMIIKVNKGVIPIAPEQIPDLEMGPNRCSIRM
ncbi:MAG: MBL fold metallo-hydrolase [Nitrososphaeria archaeon]|nr:MBL fold metallo-hydrolase [Nitrososphaeria archaeon]NDB50646.1 MBL fold metallo-hydrolase [Nitrosopumilaceae archaeon]NDB88046.1 MBL fold metallo-hydrolase [Nitrososphaerota archaeon]NDB46226.1 MBL fold metallo-hydrolase [Nitrososphaeria archaeon]NDB62558.1 MBL fold metallo-hydrolase [Nitrosopumilaceae archaeon]